MFTGIIETTSPILKIQNSRGQLIFSIQEPPRWKPHPGESISVEGVCSTVQKADGNAFQVCYMPETLRKTTLGGLSRRDLVNLERCLKLSTLMGGHLVQGHVDTTARIGSIEKDGDAKIYEFQIAPRYSRYLVEKGSIAIDGISLTLVTCRPGRFSVSLLAYTLSHTTLGNKKVGSRVNIEVDILAKYVEKLLRR